MEDTAKCWACGAPEPGFRSRRLGVPLCSRACALRIGPKVTRPKEGVRYDPLTPAASSSSSGPPRSGDSDDEGPSAAISGDQIEIAAALTWFVWEEFFRDRGFKLGSVKGDPDVATFASMLVASFMLRLHNMSSVARAMMAVRGMTAVARKLMAAHGPAGEETLMYFAESFGLGEIAMRATAADASAPIGPAGMAAFEQARRDYVRRHYRAYLREVLVRNANAYRPMAETVLRMSIREGSIRRSVESFGSALKYALQGIVNSDATVEGSQPRSVLVAVAAAAVPTNYSDNYSLTDWSPADPPTQLQAIDFEGILVPVSRPSTAVY